MMAAMAFKVGDRVKINPATRWQFGRRVELTDGRMGTVTRASLWRINVLWDGRKTGELLAAMELMAADVEFGVEPATTG